MVNDRVDIALEAQADGVHLPAAAMKASAVRRITGPGLLVGRSVHSLEEIDALLQEEVDYVHFGPVYETDSKRTFGRPQGVHKLGEAVIRAGDMPVLAVGGIDSGKAKEIVASGAWGAAVIGAVAGATNPEAETAALVAALAGAAC